MQDVVDFLEDLDLEASLTDKDMKRVIRFMLAFEDEAYRLYAHLMTSTDNSRISAVFKDIAEERRFQVVNLIRLLLELDGAGEVLH